jgi:hypothetical protein
VVENGVLLGFVTRTDIMRMVRLRAEMGAVEKPQAPV